MDESKRAELQELMQLQLDQGLETQQRVKLSDLLRDDQQAQEFYVEFCQLHAMLAWEHGVLPEVAFDSDPTTAGSKTTQRMVSSHNVTRRWKGLAIAATTILVASTLYSLANQSKLGTSVSQDASPPIQAIATPWESRSVVASLVNKVGARLTVPGLKLDLSVDDEIRNGRYELSNGLVEIRFMNRVEMIVESPALFEIESKDRVVLHRGKISAKVSPEGKGFVVDTPSSYVTDYGTEFSVSVLSDDSSEVHVHSGEVDVKPKRAPENTDAVRLVTDQATLVEGNGVVPQGIDIAKDRFMRSLSESDSESGRYEELFAELAPRVLFQMAPNRDGLTLVGNGSAKLRGHLHYEQMDTPIYAPGRVGSAIRLDGPAREAYATVDGYPKSETGQLSVSAWVRADSRPRWAAIAKHWAVELVLDDQQQETSENEGLGGQFHFGLHEDDGDLEIQVRDERGKIAKIREGTPLTLRGWQHVAFVADGRTLTLYRNGEAVGSTPCVGVAVDGPDRMGIGVKLNPKGDRPDARNPGYWHGRIDELAIFHQALSTDDIKRLAKPAK
ncbi:FecR protein [Rubripirellula obstinata]|uniref:FecR protein n=1 Tax=Rubripirellula obstinata TaxID=406547 RepID=A0A5B1CGD3_9BACT|nr:LamG domain-containing protein [Rubripirellula obstinata]KAA1260248.1 FecR protein [Rubripirellula obstinata]